MHISHLPGDLQRYDVIRFAGRVFALSRVFEIYSIATGGIIVNSVPRHTKTLRNGTTHN
jgi:hypothetical protein